MCVSAGWSGRGALWQCNMRSKVTNKVRAKEPRIMSLPPHLVYHLICSITSSALISGAAVLTDATANVACSAPTGTGTFTIAIPRYGVPLPSAIWCMQHRGALRCGPLRPPHVRTFSISIPTHPLSLPSVSLPRPRPPLSLYTYCAAASPISAVLSLPFDVVVLDLCMCCLPCPLSIFATLFNVQIVRLAFSPSSAL